MRDIVIIPARLGGERLPDKVLLKETGKTLLEHTWERACVAVGRGNVFIASDCAKVADTTAEWEGPGISQAQVLHVPDCWCGTQRVARAAVRLRESGVEFRSVINLQADEPEMPEGIICWVADAVARGKAPIATAAVPFEFREKGNPDCVTVAITREGYAQWFTRKELPHHDACRHLGIYAYHPDTLNSLMTPYNKRWARAENLEQMAFVEAGLPVACRSFNVPEIPHIPHSINTRADYTAFCTRHREASNAVLA